MGYEGVWEVGASRFEWNLGFAHGSQGRGSLFLPLLDPRLVHDGGRGDVVQIGKRLF